MQLSIWRKAAREKAGTAFAEIAVSPEVSVPLLLPSEVIEVVVGSVVIQLPKNTATKRITHIAHALEDIRPNKLCCVATSPNRPLMTDKIVSDHGFSY